MSARATATPFDPGEWSKKDFTERVRIGTNFYVLQGIGLPDCRLSLPRRQARLFVARLDVLLQLHARARHARRASGTWSSRGSRSRRRSSGPAWSRCCGFGCMSGPLGFHIWPPFTAFLHFLRPGTIKLAPFPNLPLFGGTTRTWLDVALYARVRRVAAARARAARDRRRAARADRRAAAALRSRRQDDPARGARRASLRHDRLLSASRGTGSPAARRCSSRSGSGPGVSKLTVAFGYVMPVMTVNNPLVQSRSLRQRMFVSYPDDLAPSRLGKTMAHAGTFLEFAAPLTLLFVTGPDRCSSLGMIFVLMLHGFILSNMPVARRLRVEPGQPLRRVLPVRRPSRRERCSTIGSMPLAIYLVVALLLLPLIGNLVPVAGLVPGRDALLRRQLGVERLAVPRRQLQEARPAEARRAAASASSASASLPAEQAGEHGLPGLLRSARLHLQGRALGMLLPQGDSTATRSRSTATSTARTSPARSSAGTSARVTLRRATARARPGAVRLRRRRAARHHASSRSRCSARRCTGASSTRKRGRARRGRRRRSTSSPSARPGTTARSERVDDAVVVGSGPNGLAAAVELARARRVGAASSRRATRSAAARAPPS